MSFFGKFIKVSPTPVRPMGTAYFWRRIRAKSGHSLALQRIVPLNGGGLRGYYFSPTVGIRAVDRSGVTKIVRWARDRVWCA